MNNNKQTGEETMNESYKDKFNAQMKKAGIDSLDDLKSDAEKKAFFKAVDKSHTAKNESVTEELMSMAEDLKEYTGGSISKSVNSNDVATALKNIKKGTKLYVQGKSQGGMRTSGSVVSISGDTVKIKPTASNGPTSVKVKDITMMDTLKEELDEARFTPAQISALKDKYGKLGPGAEKNAVQMDKLAKMMSKYSKSHLSQLADMGVPMVSKVAKELMK
jgi:hypothetical protein